MEPDAELLDIAQHIATADLDVVDEEVWEGLSEAQRQAYLRYARAARRWSDLQVRGSELAG